MGMASGRERKGERVGGGQAKGNRKGEWGWGEKERGGKAKGNRKAE